MSAPVDNTKKPFASSKPVLRDLAPKKADQVRGGMLGGIGKLSKVR